LLGRLGGPGAAPLRREVRRHDVGRPMAPTLPRMRYAKARVVPRRPGFVTRKASRVERFAAIF
jgi:hypothetical protein